MNKHLLITLFFLAGYIGLVIYLYLQYGDRSPEIIIPGFGYDTLIITLSIFVFLLCLLAVLLSQRKIEAHQHTNTHLIHHNQVLESLARDDALEQTLKLLTTTLASERPGLLVSLMVLGHDELHRTPTTSSSPELHAFIRHFESGASSAVCQQCTLHTRKSGYTRETLPPQAPCQQAGINKQGIVLDTLNDPAYQNAQALGITGLWSEPVLNEGDEVLGIITFYYRLGHRRKKTDELLMVTTSNLLKLVVEHHRTASENQLMRTMVEQSRDPVCLISPEEGFRLCHVNEAAVRFFGYPRDSLLNLRIPDFDRNYSLNQLQDVWKIIKTDKSFMLETSHQIASGQDVPVEISGLYLQHEGREYIAWGIRDISARKQAKLAVQRASDMAHASNERKQQAESRSRLLEALIEYSGVPAYLMDPHDDYRLVYINQAAIDHFGDSAESVNRLRITDLSTDDLDHLWQTLKSSGYLSYESRHDTSRQNQVPVEISLYYFSHEGQEYIAGYFKDISQHKQHENDLIQAKQMAEQALAVRNRFLAHMSHELRTPLNGILGLSHLALTAESLGTTRDYLEKIQYSGTNLQSLISDILDYSRIEEGGLVINPTVFNIRTVMQTVLDMKQFSIMGRNLTVISQIERHIPQYLQGDVQRLQQVLLNLVDNAVKFTAAGNITLNVDGRQEAGRYWLQFKVSDTGIGIATEHHERMFQPFVQLDDSDQRRYGGSGLGLAISTHLVRLMGGDRIKVASTPGVGSCFSFELPFAAVEAGKSGETEPSTPTQSPLATFNILIAEDNKINQVVIKSMVERQGAKTTVVDNGLQAVELLAQQKEHFDVILMDIQMPIMDGYTATRQIREQLQLKHIPIIAVTAHTMSSDQDACFQAGMNAHLSKPIDARRLVATIVEAHSAQSGRNISQDNALPDTQTSRRPLASLVKTGTDETCQTALKDIAIAIRQMDNDEQLYSEMADLFLQGHQQDMDRMRELCEQKNYPEAGRIAHTLKGLSGTLGLTRLHQAILTLDLTLRSEDYGTVEAELLSVQTEMTTALRALNQLLAAWRQPGEKIPGA